MQLRRCIKKNKPLWAVVFKWCPTASTGTSRLTLCRHALLLSASDSRQHSPRLATRSGYFSVKPKAVDVFWNMEPEDMITQRKSTDLARSRQKTCFLNCFLPSDRNLATNLVCYNCLSKFNHLDLIWYRHSFHALILFILYIHLGETLKTELSTITSLSPYNAEFSRGFMHVRGDDDHFL